MGTNLVTYIGFVTATKRLNNDNTCKGLLTFGLINYYFGVTHTYL